MFKEILLTVDLNEESSWRRALPVAVGLCRTFGARLHVLTVVPDFGMAIVSHYFAEDFEAKALAEAERRLHELTAANVPAGVEVQHIVAQGTIYEEIIQGAGNADADLIVMAAHRPKLSDYLLGPNAARVVRHARQSVMVVRD